jgi:hypothetical protein
MGEFPYVLGNNAPGFPHAFVGSAEPWNIYVGRIHFRSLVGRLDQSAYAPSVPDSARRRAAAGFVAVFTPAMLKGLEVGGTRFFHQVWPATGISRKEWTLPWHSAFSKVLTRQNELDGDFNQLASAFARWVFPRSGLEVYGEFGREDHSWNARDMILEPDHSATMGLGARKAWLRGNALLVAGFETLNARSNTLAHHRGGEGGWYLNTFIKQGHTNLGQILGAPIGVGGFSGTSLSFSHLAAGRETRVKWSRTVRQDNPDEPAFGTPDVIYEVLLERTRVLGKLEYAWGLGADYEHHRDFAGNKTNLSALARLTRW